MSPARRRRRRRRGAGKPAEGAAREARAREQAPAQQSKGRRRRRRGRGRGAGQRESSSPRSSEDLVRALPQERPKTLSAPADGTILEEVIGDLQSRWGVPQYPQEYRITLKVGDEREGRQDRGAQTVDSTDKPSTTTDAASGPRRERAPAAPRIGAVAEATRSAGGRRRRRGRRRKRGGGGGASSGS